MVPAIPEEDFPGPQAFQEAARVLQRALLAFVARGRRVRGRVLRRLRVREAARGFVDREVLGPVLRKVAEALAAFREGQELRDMRREDGLAARFAYHLRLQAGLRAMNGLLFAARLLLARATPTLPLGPGGHTQGRRPTYAFSIASIRSQQLSLHPSLRASTEALALLLRHIPRAPPRSSLRNEGVCFDLDVALFTDRFVKDRYGEWRRAAVRRRQAREAAARRRRAEAVLKKLQARQQRTRDILAAALDKAPAPPPGPRPRHVILEGLRRRRSERDEREAAALASQQALEEASFGPHPERLPLLEAYHPLHWPRRRRASLADPCGLLARLERLPGRLRVQARARRRPSLPELAPLTPSRALLFRETGSSAGLVDLDYASPQAEAAQALRRNEVRRSLELFRLRQGMLDELAVELHRFEAASKLYARRDRLALLAVFSRKIRLALARSCLSPRLPRELRRIVRPDTHYLRDFHALLAPPTARGHSPGTARPGPSQKDRLHRRRSQRLRERRNTIAEPERLGAQAEMMLDTRMKFARLVRTAREGYGMRRRRRSFDAGEAADLHSGLQRALGYEAERWDSAEVATAAQLTRDAVAIERGLLRCGFLREESDAYMGIPAADEPEPVRDDAWRRTHGVRSDEEPLRGLVSSFRARREPAEPLLTEADRALLESAAAARVAAVRNRRVELWQEHFTEEGRAYYYSVRGDYSQWEPPRDSEEAQVQLQVQCEAEDGGLYWLNEATDEVSPLLLLE